MSVGRHAPSRRVAPALIAAVVALLVGAGCSGSSPSAPPADDAAGAVTDVFGLSDDVRGCLVDGFDDSSSARAALTSAGEPSSSAQDALFGVVDGCVPADQVAAAVARSISAALPPPDTSRADAQTDCLRTAILALDADDHRTLVVGLLVLGAPADGDLASARNALVNALYDACGVTVGP